MSNLTLPGTTHGGERQLIEFYFRKYRQLNIISRH